MHAADSHTHEHAGSPPAPADALSPEHAAEQVREAALVERLRAGDNAAYEQMVRQTIGPLLATARRMLGREDEAQDSVQEAYLSAFRSLAKFEGGSRLSTWLHRITINACLMRLRTRRRKPETAIDELLPTFSDDGHQTKASTPWDDRAGGRLVQSETRALVREFIEQLPEPYRNVLLLRDIEELSTQQTAQQLEISESAVKTRLHRARQALRELLDPHFTKGNL